jgi:hypothetical protein
VRDVRACKEAIGALAVALATAGCGSHGVSSHVPSLLVPWRRIGPIAFGETRAKIQAAYGRGQLVHLSPTNVAVVFYPAVAIGVIYASSPKGKPAVAILETDAPRYRTASGIGVGTTVEQLRKIGANCSLTPDSCQLGFSVASRPGTTFLLDAQAKHVARIAISTGH